MEPCPKCGQPLPEGAEQCPACPPEPADSPQQDLKEAARRFLKSDSYQKLLSKAEAQAPPEAGGGWLALLAGLFRLLPAPVQVVVGLVLAVLVWKEPHVVLLAVVAAVLLGRWLGPRDDPKPPGSSAENPVDP